MRKSALIVLLAVPLLAYQARPVGAQDPSPEIIGDCQLELELKPGQGCALPGGGSFSIRTNGCALVRSMGFAMMSEMSTNVDSRCELADGEYAASRISANPEMWRIDSLPPEREQETVGDCRVGLELEPGQSCALPDRGSFGIRADGCVGDTPSISGRVSMSEFSMNADGACVRGGWGKGGFAASRISEDPLMWRIDSMPPE